MNLFRLFSRAAGASSSSYERVPMDYNDNDNPDAPLLSSTQLEAGPSEEENIPDFVRPKAWRWRHRRLILALVASLSILVVLVDVIARHKLKEAEPTSVTPPLTSFESGPDSEVDSDDPVTAARLSVDELFARQSSSLNRAMARYSLKTGRPPPRNYDKWFEFAKEKSCLIDDYDRIHRDFKPFYQLAEDDPQFFQRRLDIAFKMMEQNTKEMDNVVIKDGQVFMPEIHSNSYWDTWPITFGQFSAHLPDMSFLISGHDQPRVAFDYRDPGARARAFTLTEGEPFTQSPHPTSDWFYGLPGCNIPRSGEGFFASANEDSAFFISTAKTEFTTDLYPVLSMSTIDPCFADILFPIEYYYERSWWSGKVAFPNNIEWKNKKSQLYWRGSSTGGQIFGTNYRTFPRFKLVDLAAKHPDLIDAEITSFSDELCGSECDRDAVIQEYNITGSGRPREDEYLYKYLLDVDGNAFSGRYLGLLRSGSLVFKSTVFEEYFNDWIRPFEHYIPVLPDFSDLLEKLEWVMSHDDEARLIQERGREVSQRLMTDGQNDCYFFLVLLEWARLQDISRNATASYFPMVVL
ncbi:glycosyl transferase family 90-domain-containing protein [Mycena haematopus]|nr:glycosyl transferase family 90-domain-containing protein [Mycena haematopus]